MHPTKPHPAPGDTCQDTWQRLSKKVQPVTTLEVIEDKKPRLRMYTAGKLGDLAQLDEGIIGTDKTILKEMEGKTFVQEM